MQDPTSDPNQAPAPVAQPQPITYSSPPAKPVKKANRGGTVLLAVAGLIAVAGIAFAAGRFTAPPAAAANGGGRTGGFPFGSFAPGAGGFRGGFPGGGAGAGALGGGLASVEVKGQATAVTSTSITVTTSDGTSVTLPIDLSTTYHTAAAATSSSVTVGSTVDIQPGTVTGGRGTNPGAAPSLAPGATPAPFGGFSFGPATDVTVVQP